MKRWIHPTATRAAEARRLLNAIEPEKVDFVKQCYDDVLKETSKYYADIDDEEIDEEIPAISESAIKNDWIMEAVEDDIMTEEEFNEIYDLLETVGEEEAAAYS